MMRLAFPSEDFPAQAAVTLQVPDDWLPVYSPGTVLAAREQTDEGRFASNVIVRIDRRPADFEISEALNELREFAGGRREGTVSSTFEADLDGRLFVGCDVAWVDEQVGTVLQAHLFGILRSGPFVQLVQVTGSVGGAQASYVAIKDILKSLRVREVPTGPS
ncbi:MAG: hypothetical protein QOF35_1753 [Actinomycetota bacterium]|jgi:hypothetical protein|nr:hypothetical protein [Actinomycetota bacterium]